MARRPLPRILRVRGAPPVLDGSPGGRAPAAAHGGPTALALLARGLRRLAAASRSGWTRTPKERRGPLALFVAAALLTVALLPYGVPLALLTLLGAALWQGRDREQPEAPEADASTDRRLRALYEALVPYFSVPEDPSPLYAHGGSWQAAFDRPEYDVDGRLTRLVIRYPPYFADDAAEARGRVERVVRARSGRGREYRFDWDEELGELTVTALAPLPTGTAQRYRTAPDETVLGLTDPADGPWTPPVVDGAEPVDLPAVVWRTGPHAAEPHLLAVGRPGSGTSTLLRHLALQALARGDVVVVDGSGTGEHACLAGRAGVLAVETGLTGALAALEWVAQDTRRRLIAAGRMRQTGHRPPEDTTRPLWLLVDRPGPLADLAAAEGRPDPGALLRTPLRLGRTARVTVVVAEQFDLLDELDEAVWRHTRARVALGAAPLDQIAAVLGTPPHTTPTPHMPPGRGYARLGNGPVLRLQVPATPDPYDDAADAEQRQVVRTLLPKRTPGPEAPHADRPAPYAS